MEIASRKEKEDSFRELISIDKIGNEYYRIYTPDLKPLKNKVYRKEGTYLIEMDPLWQLWLEDKEAKPPSNETLGNYSLNFDMSDLGSDFNEHTASSRWEQVTGQLSEDLEGLKANDK